MPTTASSTNTGGTQGPGTGGQNSWEQTNKEKEAWQKSDPFPIATNINDVKIAVWTASQCKTNGEAALVYASYGIPVIPCNWKPNDEGVLSKYPLVGKGGLYLATTDPKQITEWWTRDPEALIGVPGGRRTGMWFHDIDSKEGHGVDGLEELWKLTVEHGDATTRGHWTGTNGLHDLYAWDPNRPVGTGKGQLPAGMEVKGEGGYVIFPPSYYERNGQTVCYRVSLDCYPEPAPSWLYDLILGERPRAKSNGRGASANWVWPEGFGKRKLDEVCELLRTAVIHHWDETCGEVWKVARWIAGGAYDISAALDEIISAAKANPTAPQPDYWKKAKRAFENGAAEPWGPYIEEEGVQLTDFVSDMNKHQYLFIPTRELWPASSVNARIHTVGEIKASTWLDQNRPIEQMTWVPGGDELIHDRLIAEGGWIERKGMTCFNLYRPPRIEPGYADKAGQWLDHVYKVFNDDDAEWIIKWLAQRVQHPAIKINHGLVLGSIEHGIGKDAMLAPVKEAVGPWNFGEVGPQQLLGRFNGFLKNVILRVSEARDLGDINRYQFYEHTKAITAAPPEVLRVDEKFLHEHSILNCVGPIITTNYKTNGIYLPAEDCRHYVAWSDLRQEDFPDGYWKKLFGWYAAEGNRHVAAYLAGVDLAGWDPKAPPPKTQAFWDIVDANQAPEYSGLADMLDALGNPPAVTLLDVTEKARAKANFDIVDWLQDRKNRRIIPSRFEQCGYVPVRNPDREDHLWKIRDKRQVVYALRELSLQEQLKAAVGLM